ncbi:hypothetical protein [Streptomyces prasinus]
MTVLGTVYVVLHFPLGGLPITTATNEILALRNDSSRSLRILGWANLLVAGSFMVTYPAVCRWIGTASGIPTLGSLLIYLCIFGFAVHSHVLVRLWSQDCDRP